MKPMIPSNILNDEEKLKKWQEDDSFRYSKTEDEMIADRDELIKELERQQAERMKGSDLEYRLVGECAWTASGFSCGYLEMYDTGCGDSSGLTATEQEGVNGMYCKCGDRIKLIQQTTEE